jgi:hypothetical protein
MLIDVRLSSRSLKEIGATIVRRPMDGTWAPGYYYVLFEDPDGIRLEVNFVPGAGVLAEGRSSTRRPATSSHCGASPPMVHYDERREAPRVRF